ncbi:MAG: response regulator [Desulfohalobiaceae bacterium]
MRTLIVEDDFYSRKIMQTILAEYGECDVAVNGEEAVEAFKQALDEGRPYSLICLDIMMPVMDGHQALQRIRDLEDERDLRYGKEVKVLMTTALGDIKNVNLAFFKGAATSYLVKPLQKEKLLQELRLMELIE